MGVNGTDSNDPSDVIELVGQATEGLPWIVPLLLIVMIISGVVLLIVKLRTNASDPNHTPLSKDRKKPPGA